MAKEIVGRWMECSCGWAGNAQICYMDSKVSKNLFVITCPRSVDNIQPEGELHILKISSTKEKKKMLFVDDRTKRIHYALNNFSDYEVTIATCVPEALRQMVKEDYDAISLDHDLMGHDFEDPDTPGCGMEIVRYIEKTGWPSGSAGIHKPIPEFWIHSSNLFAAHLMIVKLSAMGLSAYYKPIVYKVENMKYGKEGLPIL